MRKRRLSEKEAALLAEMQAYCEEGEDCRRKTFSSKFGTMDNIATGNA